MKLNDILDLARAGYKFSEVKELLEMADPSEEVKPETKPTEDDSNKTESKKDDKDPIEALRELLNN